MKAERKCLIDFWGQNGQTHCLVSSRDIVTANLFLLSHILSFAQRKNTQKKNHKFGIELEKHLISVNYMNACIHKNNSNPVTFNSK